MSARRLYSTSDRNCSTTIHNKLNHCDGPKTINMPHVFSNFTVRITRSCQRPRHLKLIAIERSLWQQHVVLCPPSCLFPQSVKSCPMTVACSTVGVKETPEKFHRPKVDTSQDMRRSTRNASTLKCLFFPVLLYHDAYVAIECVGARNLTADVGPTQ